MSKTENAIIESLNMKLFLCLAALFFLVCASPVFSMERLGDSELGSVQAKDGLTVDLSSSSISASEFDLRFDRESVSDGYESDALGLKTLEMSATNGGDFSIQTELDAFTHDNGKPAMAWHTLWEEPITLKATPQVRRVFDESPLGGAAQTLTGGSLGEMAFTTVGELLMVGGSGFLDYGPGSRFLLNLGEVDAVDYSVNQGGALFYRQDSAELALGDLGLLLDVENGGLGADADGLVLQGDSAKFNLTFNLFFDSTGASPFSLDTADEEMLHYGFSGGLVNPYLSVRSGGARESGIATGGINFALHSDFESDFAWEVGGSQAYLKFNDWQKLQNSSDSAPHFIDIPYVALDAFNAGFSPEPICWGADAAGASSYSGCGGSGGAGNAVMGTADVFAPQELKRQASNVAQGIIVRDLALSSYSTSVEYYDSPTDTNPIEEEWALIYTLGDVDANLLLYPQSGPGEPITADVLVTAQTFDNGDQQSRWLNGTHFMIGDTGSDLAIGFVGADMLFGAREMEIDLNSSGLSLRSNHARFALRGLFGGGPIPNMQQQQNIFHGDLNIESDDVRLTLSPGSSADSLAFSGYLSLTNLSSGLLASTAADDNHSTDDDGTYISLAEPSYDRLDVDVRFADIQGDIQIASGEFDLKNNQGAPELTISNHLKVGSSISDSNLDDEALVVNRVEFGDKSLGKIVMPGGQLNASLTLKQQ